MQSTPPKLPTGLLLFQKLIRYKLPTLTLPENILGNSGLQSACSFFENAKLHGQFTDQKWFWEFFTDFGLKRFVLGNSVGADCNLLMLLG